MDDIRISEKKMDRLSPGRIWDFVGFFILCAVVLLLFTYTGYQAWVLHSLGEIVVVTVIIGLLYGLFCEWQTIRKTGGEDIPVKENIRIFTAVVAGAVITYTLKVNVGLGAVLAAGLVALIASLVLPAYGVPIYCGAFVGMTSSRLLVNHTELSFAAIIAAVLYLLTDRVFRGYGGKLGTIAFAGTLFTGLGLEREFIITTVPDWELAAQIIIFSAVSATLTYWLSVYLKHGGVVASGIVGLTGGLILPAVYPEPVGNTLAVMVICGSFAGMSGKDRFPHLLQIVFAGWVTGMIFIYSMPLAGGAGGKLGTIAFGSVIAVRGYLNFLQKIRSRHKSFIK